MRERFSHRSRDLVIRPLGVLLAYECLFEATHGPVQIARCAPPFARRHFPKSRDLSLAGLGNVVHSGESIVFGRKLKRGFLHSLRREACCGTFRLVSDNGGQA